MSVSYLAGKHRRCFQKARLRRCPRPSSLNVRDKATPRSSGFKIPRTNASNLETQGMGFPVILLAYPRSMLQGFRVASFSGALHPDFFERPG